MKRWLSCMIEAVEIAIVIVMLGILFDIAFHGEIRIIMDWAIPLEIVGMSALLGHEAVRLYRLIKEV
ncbi:unnamed protein product [marine sediment metagenome]|uniref:Uncharacterized protein n=1 Tax=marine sediment metagenome TaxID=412755 RepID=X1R110_9ZZZZ